MEPNWSGKKLDVFPLGWPLCSSGIMQSLMDVGVNMSAFSYSEIIVRLQLLVKRLYESLAISLLES